MEQTGFRRTYGASYFEGHFGVNWTIDIGSVSSTDNVNSRFPNWTTSKTIKIEAREWGNNAQTQLHTTEFWDGTGDDVFSAPQLEIVAIGESSGQAVTLTNNSVNDLSDISFNSTTTTDGQALVWNSTDGVWEAGAVASSGGASYYSSTIENISDIIRYPGYIVSSSSFYDQDYPVEYAFSRTTAESNGIWISANNKYSNGSYTGSESTNSYGGEWVQINFGKNVKVYSYVIVGQSHGSNLYYRAPGNYKLFGSNNGTNWTAVHTGSASLSDYSPDHNSIINNTLTTPSTYQYFRLVINSTVGSTTMASLQYLSLQGTFEEPDVVTSVMSGLDVSFNNLDISGVLATNKSNNQISLGAHIIPTTNSTYDLGSAEYKIRHLFLSSNSLWVGEDHKIEVSDGKMRFRKLKKDALPSGLSAIPEASLEDAVAVGKTPGSNASAFSLADWEAYSKAKGNPLKIDEIFLPDDINDDDGLTDTISSSDISFNVVDASGLNVFGTASMQSIIPPITNTYSLGSATHVWKDVYIGPGSLYIDGQKVLESNADTIVVGADENQNLKLNTTGTGVLQIESAAGIQISSTGAGNVELGSTGTGIVRITDNLALNGNVEIFNDSSDMVKINDSLMVTGDISFNGNLYQNGVLFQSGSGGGGGLTDLSATSISDLSDVSLNGIQVNQSLKWDGEKLVPYTLATTATSITKQGQVLETLTGVCDGRTVVVESGSYTLPNVTAYQDTTTSWTDVAGSNISYKPPPGTKQVIYELYIQITSDTEAGTSSNNRRGDFQFELLVDNNRIEINEHQFSDEYWYQLSFLFRGIIDIGVDDLTNGKISSWDTNKEIKLQVMSSKLNTYLSRINCRKYAYDEDTTGAGVYFNVSQPTMKITAIGESSGQAVTLTNNSVNDLSDISFNSTTTTDGQALVWNSTDAVWEAGTVASSGGLTDLSATSISDLSDVSLNGIQVNQSLKWDGEKLVPYTLATTATSITKQGQVLEILYGLCNGSTVEVESGTYTMPSLPAHRSDGTNNVSTTTYTKDEASEITYTAPPGTDRIEFKFTEYIHWSNIAWIMLYIFCVDDVEIANTETLERGGQYAVGPFTLTATITSNDIDLTQSHKYYFKLKHGETSSFRYGPLEEVTPLWGLQSNDGFIPKLKITAIGESSGQAVTLTNNSVSDLSDISFNSTTTTDGQALVWNSTDGVWEAGAVASSSGSVTNSIGVNMITKTYSDISTITIPTGIPGLEIPGLYVDITPTANDSIIELKWNIFCEVYHDSIFRITRNINGTDVLVVPASNIWEGGIALPTFDNNTSTTAQNINFSWYDSPNTTLPITYKVWVGHSGSTTTHPLYLNRTTLDIDTNGSKERGVSTVAAIEHPKTETLVPATSITKQGQILEILSGHADGSTVTVNSGTYTMPQFNSLSIGATIGTTYMKENASEITYKAPAGTERIIFTFEGFYEYQDSGALLEGEFYVDDVVYPGAGSRGHFKSRSGSTPIGKISFPIMVITSQQYDFTIPHKYYWKIRSYSTSHDVKYGYSSAHVSYYPHDLPILEIRSSRRNHQDKQ